MRNLIALFVLLTLVSTSLALACTQSSQSGSERKNTSLNCIVIQAPGGSFTTDIAVLNLSSFDNQKTHTAVFSPVFTPAMNAEVAFSIDISPQNCNNNYRISDAITPTTRIDNKSGFGFSYSDNDLNESDATLIRRVDNHTRAVIASESLYLVQGNSISNNEFLT